MNKVYGKVWRIFLILLMAGSAFACAKKAIPTQPGFGPGAGGEMMGGPGGAGGGLGPDDAKWKELGINSEAEKREFLDKAQTFENEDIYFNFDAFTLSDPAKKILDAKAAFLKRYAKTRVTVEGHCDERGTTEYNLALGERRATSAMQYLVNSGVSQQRIGTISYGKERPIASGHDETSWAKNRRDHFTLNY